MVTNNSNNEPTAASGKVLQGQGVGTASNFSTATYPATTTINQVLYSSAANVVSEITAVNNGTMISGATGIPSLLTNGTTGQFLTATTGAPPSWTTIVSGGDVVGPAGATSTAIAVYNGATGKIIQNSIPTIDSSGNILTSASLSGATLSIDVVNSSNTANSAARLSTVVAGSSAGDAVFQASVSGGQVWTWGLDNSDTDAFVLSSSVSLGTTNVMKSTLAGEITYPLQPAFLGNLNAAALNKTGNGTTYTLGTDALTEIYDQGSDFTTAGVFTAPVTAKYPLYASIILSGCTINANTVVTIVTSNRSYAMANGHPATAQDNGCSISHICDMDAADTATVTVFAVGEAGDTDDVAAGAKFSGYLAV